MANSHAPNSLHIFMKDQSELVLRKTTHTPLEILLVLLTHPSYFNNLHGKQTDKTLMKRITCTFCIPLPL